jgi:hypothetical protein
VAGHRQARISARAGCAEDKDAAEGNDLVADAPPIYIQEKIDQPEPS